MRRGALASVAKPVIIKMCADDKSNCNYQKKNFVLNKKLLQYKKNKSETEN